MATEHAPRSVLATHRGKRKSDPTLAPQTRTAEGSKWWTLAVLCIATFMLLLDVTVVNVALPGIERDLGASFSDLQWVISAYALTLGATLLTAGSVADRVGRRRVFTFGLILFSLASLGCGLAGSPLALNLARGVQGFGGAAMFATSLALLADAFPGHRERRVALAFWGATTGAAVAIGPLVGGLIIAVASWKWIFLVNLPVGVIALTLTLLRVRESRDPDAGPMDWAGLVLFGTVLGGLIFGLQRGNADGWGSTPILATLGAAAVALALFILVERRRRKPMLDLALFSKPTTSGASLAVLAMAAGVFAMLLFLTLYLQNVLGYDALAAGLRLLPLTVPSFFAAAISARLSERIPLAWLLGAGLALAGTGLLLMRGVTAGGHWTALLAGLIVTGFGIGITNPAVASAALAVAPAARSGMASGLNATFRIAGVAIGVAALGSVFQSRVHSDVVATLAGTPLGPRSQQLAKAFASGDAHTALRSLPPGQRGLLAQTAESSFVSGLHAILLIAAIVCFAGSALSLALVRRRDFVPQQAETSATEGAQEQHGTSLPVGVHEGGSTPEPGAPRMLR
jgi:EmrB/QacA subfamily drug resistance transporter